MQNTIRADVQEQEPVTLQEIHSYVIVRNPTDNQLFDIVAIGMPDETGEHDVLFYAEDSLDFEDACDKMEYLNNKLEETLKYAY